VDVVDDAGAERLDGAVHEAEGDGDVVFCCAEGEGLSCVLVDVRCGCVDGSVIVNGCESWLTFKRMIATEMIRKYVLTGACLRNSPGYSPSTTDLKRLRLASMTSAM